MSKSAISKLEKGKIKVFFNLSHGSAVTHANVAGAIIRRVNWSFRNLNPFTIEKVELIRIQNFARLIAVLSECAKNVCIRLSGDAPHVFPDYN
jgi:hypothetical protein